MCRFIAYHGDAIYLEDLIATPRHSLVKQSLCAEQARTVTQGDGFGIGWYGERDEPAVYREVMPAWSDENLLALAATV
ncbi:MAG: class II glutamine amidotransferase, partial [Burkholderiaceae bacterium]|nr:class II glutamine amidotransferase [Burkholderiaceae bacterium]